MKKTLFFALGAMVLASSLASAPVKAAVAVSVGIAAPADECVKYRAHHRRHVVRYEYCDAPVWSGDPIVLEGVTYHDNLHYRMWHGHRQFWVKGHWVVHD